MLCFQIDTYFLNTVDFDDNLLLENVRPELKEGVTIVYTSELFETSIFTNKKKMLGIYIPLINFIKINVNPKDLNDNLMTVEELLCHELCHYKWYKFMTKEEKKEFVELFDELDEDRKPFYISPNELHSEWCEIHLEECFVK